MFFFVGRLPHLFQLLLREILVDSKQFFLFTVKEKDSYSLKTEELRKSLLCCRDIVSVAPLCCDLSSKFNSSDYFLLHLSLFSIGYDLQQFCLEHV